MRFLIRSFFKLLKKDSATAAHAGLQVMRVAETPQRITSEL